MTYRIPRCDPFMCRDLQLVNPCVSRYLLVVAEGVPVCISVGRHLLGAGGLGAEQESLHLLWGQHPGAPQQLVVTVVG